MRVYRFFFDFLSAKISNLDGIPILKNSFIKIWNSQRLKKLLISTDETLTER